MKGQTMNRCLKMKRYDFYKLAAEIADCHTVTFPDADEPTATEKNGQLYLF